LGLLGGEHFWHVDLNLGDGAVWHHHIDHDVAVAAVFGWILWRDVFALRSQRHVASSILWRA